MAQIRMFRQIVLLFGVTTLAARAGRLPVRGTHLVKDGHRVFLSGANVAWVHYGHDFGNNQYSGVKAKYEQILADMQSHGGNSLRVWLHIEGDTTPAFDNHGHVTSTDSSHSLVNDMKTLLHAAQHHNILIFFVLWNGAKKQSPHWKLHGLIVDTIKLQSYIDHALVPMVSQLASEPALGGWEVMNEPEGELTPGLHNSNRCFDTSALSGSGAGWVSHTYTPQQLQRFINWQADAIRRTDPGAMVTVGAWNAKSNTDNFHFVNHWSDTCIVQAGGRQQGKLTFYQVHTYAGHSGWDGYSPMQKSFPDYSLHKPLVIGEFRQSQGAGMSIQNMYNHAYYYGYSGAWAWQAVDNNWGNIKTGMAWLRGRHDQHKGGLVNFSV